MGTLIRQAIQYKKWYAIAATPEGKKLVKHLGFEKIEGKRDVYLLTDIKRATKPIRSFIDTLEQEESPLVRSPKADSKVDSITERKREKMVDTSRQNSTNQKPLSRSRSHSSQLLANNEK